MPQPTFGPAGAAIYDAITDDCDLQEHERFQVEQAARLADEIERLRGELEAAPLIVKGSQGQPVAQPLIEATRSHRLALTRILASLKIPAPEDAAPVDPETRKRSEAARKAANARWGNP